MGADYLLYEGILLMRQHSVRIEVGSDASITITDAIENNIEMPATDKTNVVDTAACMPDGLPPTSKTLKSKQHAWRFQQENRVLEPAKTVFGGALFSYF